MKNLNQESITIRGKEIGYGATAKVLKGGNPHLDNNMKSETKLERHNRLKVTKYWFTCKERWSDLSI